LSISNPVKFRPALVSVGISHENSSTPTIEFSGSVLKIQNFTSAPVAVNEAVSVKG
jgi:hypothetical protein